MLPSHYSDRRQTGKRTRLALEARCARPKRGWQKLESELIQAQDEAETLTRTIASLTAQLETLGDERGGKARARLPITAQRFRQMEGEAQRIERRLQEWHEQAVRNRDARESREQAIAGKREEAARLEADQPSWRAA